MLTETQRLERRNHLGASDMAAIFGLDPFKTAADVWLDKTGKLQEQTETLPMQLGNRLEPLILDLAEAELGPMQRNVFLLAPEPDMPLACNLDGMVIKTGNPCEAKTHGILFPGQGDWGEPGTDEIPLGIIIQTQTQLYCAQREICHVPALLGGWGYQMFRVLRNEILINEIRAQAVEFWDYVKRNVPPPDSLPHLEVLKRIRRQPSKVIDIPADLVLNLEKAKVALKEAQTEEELAKVQVINALADAEAGNYDGGVVTYMEQSRGEYVVKPTTFRVLRIKAKKGA